MMGNWNYGFGGWSGMFLGWALMLVFLVLIIWAIAAFIHGMMKQNEKGGRSSALDILEERYVKGEISKEEFEEKKVILRK